MNKEPSLAPPDLPELLLGVGDWTSPVWIVHFFAHRSVADSTSRTYKSGLNRYLSFCHKYNVPSPLPASESLLCYFVVELARQGLAPGTIKTYLAAVRHA